MMPMVRFVFDIFLQRLLLFDVIYQRIARKSTYHSVTILNCLGANDNECFPEIMTKISDVVFVQEVKLKNDCVDNIPLGASECSDICALRQNVSAETRTNNVAQVSV